MATYPIKSMGWGRSPHSACLILCRRLCLCLCLLPALHSLRTCCLPPLLLLPVPAACISSSPPPIMALTLSHSLSYLLMLAACLGCW